MTRKPSSTYCSIESEVQSLRKKLKMPKTEHTQIIELDLFEKEKELLIRE